MDISRIQLFSHLSILIMVLSISGVGVYYSTNFTVENLTQDILTQSIDQVEVKSREILNSSKILNKAFVKLLKQETDLFNNPIRTKHSLTSLLLSHPLLSYVSFSNENDMYFEAYRSPKSEIFYTSMSSLNQGHLLEVSRFSDGNFKLIKSNSRSRRIKPTLRDYYKSTKKSKKASWSSSYFFQNNKGESSTLGISYRVPIFNEERFFGVMTIDFTLDALSKILSNMDYTFESSPYIVELNYSNKTNKIIAKRNSEFDNFFSFDRSIYDGKSDFKSIEFNNNSTFILSEKVKVNESVDWLIVIFVKKSAIFAGIDKRNKQVVALWIIGVLLSILFAIIIGKTISQKIKAVINEMKKVSDFELEPKQVETSRINELDYLANSIEDMKLGLRSFKKFVPHELVRRIIKNQEEVKLGGDREYMTVYFSDIKDFTSLAEKWPAQTIALMLEDYLGSMTNGLISREATVDKYIGDAIMAFWGAPDKVEYHEAKACASALENLKSLEELNERWKAKGWPSIDIRIGINSGEVIVGNFGCSSRLDYTAVGDNVNLASRLESVNKVYGTKILVSEQTQAKVKDQFIFRYVDKISVKGKTEATKIYELVAPLSQKMSTEYLDLHHEALELYFSQKWKDAQALWEKLLVIKSQDLISEVMIERCEKNNGSFESDWDGVFRLKQK